MFVRTPEFYEELLLIGVSINDPEAFRKILPEALRLYVLGKGWVEDVLPPPLYREDVWYYGHPSNPDFNQAVMVLSERYVDYARRVRDSVQALAKFENRSELAVYADLLEINPFAKELSLFKEWTSEFCKDLSSGKKQETSPELWAAAEAALERQAKLKEELAKDPKKWDDVIAAQARWIAEGEDDK